MTVKTNEIGKELLINANFDLLTATLLRFVLVSPAGIITTKLSTIDPVSAPNIERTEDVDGVPTLFKAGEYFQYLTEAGVLTESGDNWQMHGEYVDATPKDFAGDVVVFTVLPRTPSG